MHISAFSLNLQDRNAYQAWSGVETFRRGPMHIKHGLEWRHSGVEPMHIKHGLEWRHSGVEPMHIKHGLEWRHSGVEPMCTDLLTD